MSRCRIAIIGLKYRVPLEDALLKRGIAPKLVFERIEWIDEDVALLQVRTVTILKRVVPLYKICTKLNIPAVVTSTRFAANTKLVLPVEFQASVVQFCVKQELEINSVLFHIRFEEDVEIPVYVHKQRLSVRSTKPGRIYDTLFVPKLLKFLRDPSDGVWLVISLDYQEVVKQWFAEHAYQYDLFAQHVEWTAEKQVFEFILDHRTLVSYTGETKSVNLNIMRTECVTQVRGVEK